MCGPRVRVVSAVAVGALLLFLGILALTFAPSLIDNAVLAQDYLGYETKEVNGTRVLNKMTQQWQTPPYDMTLQIYFFDVKNVKEVMNGAKPAVEEVGPFTFVEKQAKTFKFSHNETRVLYRNKRTYFFSQSQSCPTCVLGRNITIPSIIFQKLIDVAEKGFPYDFAIRALLTAVKRESPFISVRANELLFDGYEDPVISALCSNPVLKFLCAENGTIPEKIGFFYNQNGTDDGEYEIHTGLGKPLDIGKMFSWNNMTSLPAGTWDSPYARMINGTDGQTFPPQIQKGDSFTLFAAQAGRSIFMEYTEVSAFRDVPSFRFAIPSSMFDPAYHNNREFCNKDTPQFFNVSVQIPTCLPKGLIDVGRTQPGAPRAYLSQAHFFDAEQYILDGIVGMKKANAKNDTTYVDIEPNSGVPIRARRAMQINIGMLKGGKLEMMSKTKNMILPVLWMNETITFDEDTRSQLHALNIAKRSFFIGGVGFVVAGATVWIALAAVLLIFTLTKKNQSAEEYQPLENEEEPVVEEL